MTDDSDLFRTRETLEADGWHLHGNVFTRAGKRMLPLYEAKMAHLFDHRWRLVMSATAVNRQISRHLTLAEKHRTLPRCAILATGSPRTGRFPRAGTVETLRFPVCPSASPS